MEDDLHNDFLKCSRNIKNSKYERNDPQSRNWWHNLFETIEHDFNIPPHRRVEVLRDSIPEELVDKILEIISTDELNNYGQQFERRMTTIRPLVDIESVESSASGSSRSTFNPHTMHKMTLFRTRPPTIDEYSINDSILTDCSLSDYSKENIVDKKKGYINPYKNFLSKRDDAASIWRPKPPLLFEGMSLQQKTDVITERIAIDFIEWLKNIGGDETLTLDKKGVIDMFEIGFHMHAATSLCVQVKEMPCVSKAIAIARNVPEASKRELLRKQLFRDIKAATAKRKYIAFGRCLPQEMRVFPPRGDIAKKWIHSTRVPEKIATMAGVWEGIEHLRSTRGYCKWLISHPSIPPPIYLKKAGMLNPNIDERKYSLDSEQLPNTKL